MPLHFTQRSNAAMEYSKVTTLGFFEKGKTEMFAPYYASSARVRLIYCRFKYYFKMLELKLTPRGYVHRRVHNTPRICLDSPVLFSVPSTAKTCSTSLKVTSVQGTGMTLTQGGSEKPHPSGSSPSGQCLGMAAFLSAPLPPLSQHWGKQWCPSITREYHCCANLSRFFPRKIQPWCF